MKTSCPRVLMISLVFCFSVSLLFILRQTNKILHFTTFLIHLSIFSESQNHYNDYHPFSLPLLLVVRVSVYQYWYQYHVKYKFWKVNETTAIRFSLAKRSSGGPSRKPNYAMLRHNGPVLICHLFEQTFKFNSNLLEQTVKLRWT